MLSLSDRPGVDWPLGAWSALKSLVGVTLRDRLHIEPHRFSSQTFAYHLARLLRFHEVNCVIDVGANAGQYGEMLRNVGYRSRIVSFEPVAEAFAALRTCRPRDRQWLKFRLALGAEDGSKEINVFGLLSAQFFPRARL